MDRFEGLPVPRQAHNCQPCKKRKIKCDRKIPCGPCSLRGDGKNCVPVVVTNDHVPEDGNLYVALKDFRLLSRQVSELQDKVDALEASIGRKRSQPLRSISGGIADDDDDDRNGAGDDDDDDDGDDDDEEGDDDEEERGSKASAKVAGITARIHPGDDEMVFALEDFQMSHRLNAKRSRPDSPFVAASDDSGGGNGAGRVGLNGSSGSGGGGGGSGAGGVGGLSGTHHRVSRVDESHPFAFMIPVGTDYIARALEALPDQPTSVILVQHYFENVEWFQRTLHYATFIRQCQQLWSNSLATSDDPDFVCCYLMVVCLALRTLDPRTAARLGMSVPGALAVADKLYHVAEGVLWFSRFLHRQAFESLQAISLMTIYGYDVDDGSDATWALCGSAIKIGQNLGLSRLEAEAPGKTWAPMWSSRLKREIGRRVWWTFVGLDWSHAIAHSSTYCVHPSQNLCVLPSNIEDDQLDDPSAVAQPMSVRTSISMQIFKFKFTMLYREITDHMASHSTPSYPFILAMDEAIIQLTKSLPEHFKRPALQPETSPQHLLTDSIYLNIIANTRLVRLHRYFLMRSYRDSRYSRSKDRCVTAAVTILDLLQLARVRAPSLLQFWVVFFYAFSAAVVVSIDLLQEPADAKRQLIVKVLDIFRDHGMASAAARNSIYVLERLLQAEADLRFNENRATKKLKLDTGSSSGGSGGGGGGGPASSPEDLLKATVSDILRSAPSSKRSTSSARTRGIQPGPPVYASNSAVPPINAVGVGVGSVDVGVGGGHFGTRGGAEDTSGSVTAGMPSMDPFGVLISDMALFGSSGSGGLQGGIGSLTSLPTSSDNNLGQGWSEYPLDALDTLWTAMDPLWTESTMPRQTR